MKAPKTICIIDDDKVYTFMLKRMLQKLGVASNIVDYSNGLEALESIKGILHDNKEEVLPDIIFLDINMPVMNGWQFLEAYSEIKPKIAKRISIYQTSSSLNQSDIDKSMSFETVTKYIAKSIDMHTLHSLVLGEAV